MKLPLRILHDVALLVILNDGKRKAAPKVAITFVLAASNPLCFTIKRNNLNKNRIFSSYNN